MRQYSSGYPGLITVAVVLLGALLALAVMSLL